MELRVLKYFLAVAREENITLASKKLHITQPTLSKQLMDLEYELGKKLFIRGKRKITLTDEGMFLKKRAQEIVDLADKTEAVFHSKDKDVVGDVYIGAGETDSIRYIAKTLKHLRESYPNIRFNLYSGNAQDIMEKIDKGLIDFGLFVGSADFKKYDYLKLPTSNTWGLLVRYDDPLASCKSISPEKILNLPIICSIQALNQNELSGSLGYSLDKLNIIGTYNLIYNASIMVEEGIGYAITIDRLINSYGNKNLCFVPFEPKINTEIIIAWKKYQVFSKASEKFLEMFQDQLNNYN